jgi:hypothetical protein
MTYNAQLTMSTVGLRELMQFGNWLVWSSSDVLVSTRCSPVGYAVFSCGVTSARCSTRGHPRGRMGIANQRPYL